MLDSLEGLLGGMFLRQFNLVDEGQEPLEEMKSDMFCTANWLN